MKDFSNASLAAQAQLGSATKQVRPTPALEEAIKRLHDIVSRLATSRAILGAEMDRINGPRLADVCETACETACGAGCGGSAIGSLFDVIGALSGVATDIQSEVERAQSI